MLKEIYAINYKTKEVTKIKVSILEPCVYSYKGCNEKAGGAIIFDEPYVVEDESVQGEVYFCKTHIVSWQGGDKPQ